MLEHITSSYTGEDATLEIVVMLTVAFVLGMLFRYFIGKRRILRMDAEVQQLQRSRASLRNTNNTLRERLEHVESLAKEYQRELEKESTADSEEAIIRILRRSI